MFDSDHQRNDVCRSLLNAVHRPELWTDDGPSDVAIDYLDHGSPLSHGEQIMLHAAFDFWNGRGRVTLDDLLSVLDDRNLRAVLEAIYIARPGVAPRG